MTRWIIASLAFLAIGWLNFRYGHVVALVTLVALLIFVAVFGIGLGASAYLFYGLLGYWGGALLFFSDRNTLNPVKRIGKGLFTLYGVTSILGDVLSYARLLALGIATGVIAGTVNILADMVKQVPIIGIVVFVPVLIFGHMFNLLTSSMSAFVHSVRLQFMEFFQKFYTGEGRLFAPFTEKRKYTLLKMQEK